MIAEAEKAARPNVTYELLRTTYEGRRWRSTMVTGSFGNSSADPAPVGSGVICLCYFHGRWGSPNEEEYS